MDKTLVVGGRERTMTPDRLGGETEAMENGPPAFFFPLKFYFYLPLGLLHKRMYVQLLNK